MTARQRAPQGRLAGLVELRPHPSLALGWLHGSSDGPPGTQSISPARSKRAASSSAAELNASTEVLQQRPLL